MNKNSPYDSLDKSIVRLKTLRDQELNHIKTQLHEIHESLMPKNIIKDTIRTITTSDKIKQITGNAIVWSISGFLIKKLLFRGSLGPLKVASRFLLQTATTGLIYKNSDKLASKGNKLIHALTSKINH